MNLMRKIFLLLLIQMSCFRVSTLYGGNLEDILLIINFNHPYYTNIDFLRKLYAPYFKTIIFYGEKENDQVINVATNTGYLLSPIIKDALARFPSSKGYLFLQDDCVLHPWNLLKLDQEKIWYAVRWYDGVYSNDKFYSICNKNGHIVSGASWFKWEYPCGLPAARSALDQLTLTDKITLNKNLGHNNIAGAMCEVFYIPAQYRESFLRLSNTFEDVFCEIAIPTMLCCLDVIKNWEHLNMLGGSSVGLGNPGSPMLINYPIEKDWIHPIKFSYEENRTKILNIFETQHKKSNS